MKKKYITVFFAASVLCAALLMSGCGSSENSASSSSQSETSVSSASGESSSASSQTGSSSSAGNQQSAAAGSSGNTSAGSSGSDSAKSDTAAANTQLSVTSRWYNSDEAVLANATVIVSSGDTQLYSAVTDASGNLAAFTVPVNTELTFTVKDSSGKQLASSRMTYRSDSSYTQLLIHPISSGNQTVDVPSADTAVVSAMFINKNQQVENAAITKKRG
jgi:hypothetical protein